MPSSRIGNCEDCGETKKISARNRCHTCYCRYLNARRNERDFKRRSELVKFRVTSREKKRIQNLAKQKGLNVSQYLLEVVLGGHDPGEGTIQDRDRMILLKKAKGLSTEEALQELEQETSRP